MMPQQQVLLNFYKKHPMDAAKQLQKQSATVIVNQLGLLPITHAVDILNQFTIHDLIDIIPCLPETLVTELIGSLSIDKFNIIMHNVPSSQNKQLYSHIPKHLIATLKKLQENYVNRAVSICKLRFTALNTTMSVQEARTILLKNKNLMPSYFVIDDTNVLRGQVFTIDILSGKKDQVIMAFMHNFTQVVPAQTNMQQVLEHKGWRANTELPVTDHKNRLLGILYLNDIYQLLASKKILDPMTYLTDSADIVVDAMTSAFNLK